jgi:hypothetical protein
MQAKVIVRRVLRVEAWCDSSRIVKPETIILRKNPSSILWVLYIRGLSGRSNATYSIASRNFVPGPSSGYPIALPLTVPLVKILKRTENVDYFDIDTDFNPLHLRMRLTTPGDAETSNALSRRQIP